MNATETLLTSLDVKVDPFAVCDVSSGYHLDLHADKVCSIHYVLSGSGLLTTNTGCRITLEPDQMILIPMGMPQRIQSTNSNSRSDNSASLCLQPSENLNWLKSANGDTDLVLACGHIYATYGQCTDIFSLLNEPIVERFSDSATIRTAFESILHEFCEPKLGTLALTSTLMKQCLIVLLRRLHESNDQRLPWLAVLEKKGLLRAVEAILKTPDKAFRVEDLADIALMSRSTFTEQFTRVLGQPPHEFLSNYRLRLAASLLSTTDLPVKSIASRVGFQSRSSFSRAFKALYSIDPKGYRSSAT